MSSDDSITRWIEDVKEGDSDAARKIWQRYFPELVRLARTKLQGTRRGMADEEDVALSAMNSFCDAARNDRFPDLSDRHGLWRLLLHITAQKAVDLARHERRQRRGGGRVRGESILARPGLPADRQAFAEVVGDVPTPEFAAQMAEQCSRLLGLLDDPQLRTLAVAKMEGYENREIAERLQCSLRTVERRLQLIRAKWAQEPAP